MKQSFDQKITLQAKRRNKTPHLTQSWRQLQYSTKFQEVYMNAFRRNPTKFQHPHILLSYSGTVVDISALPSFTSVATAATNPSPHRCFTLDKK
jgi:hypothetical protein